MAKIEIEIDDKLLAHVPSSGRSLEELVRKGLELALWEYESQSLLEEWFEEQAEDQRQRSQEHAAWATRRPEIAASHQALCDAFGQRSEEHRQAAVTLTEKQAATFAWLHMITRALSQRRPVDDLHIDLDNPAHWQAALDYVQSALYRHFKYERSALEFGEHPLLSPASRDET